ncbi:MAG: hypothetical protein FJW30_23395 [Acidobacteria bacterium]|nr:hypothetical protein [Acidobacteriota bacterium]
MIFRGVVAKVWPLNSIYEELRFVPLEVDRTLVAGGDQRLRITRCKPRDPDPGAGEWDLTAFAGRMVALEGSSMDEKWIYECPDVARYQR